MIKDKELDSYIGNEEVFLYSMEEWLKKHQYEDIYIRKENGSLYLDCVNKFLQESDIDRYLYNAIYFSLVKEVTVEEIHIFVRKFLNLFESVKTESVQEEKDMKSLIEKTKYYLNLMRIFVDTKSYDKSRNLIGAKRDYREVINELYLKYKKIQFDRE